VPQAAAAAGRSIGMLVDSQILSPSPAVTTTRLREETKKPRSKTSGVNQGVYQEAISK